MAATAGPAPWTDGYRRLTKRTAPLVRGADLSWSQYKTDSNEFSADYFNKVRKPKMKQVRLASGQIVHIPDADYEDFMGFKRAAPGSNDRAIVDYIDRAFDNVNGYYEETEGVGHITLIEYSPTYQLLRVEFATDGAVCIFFRVPKEVYAELKHLATTGQTQISSVDGSQRHVLGIRFWDIIRIRGQREGSRYKFQYVIEGEYQPKGRAARALGQQGEMTEYLNDFTRRLTPNAKRVYDNLTTDPARYSFLVAHGVELPTYEELMSEDF